MVWRQGLPRSVDLDDTVSGVAERELGLDVRDVGPLVELDQVNPGGEGYRGIVGSAGRR